MTLNKAVLEIVSPEYGYVLVVAALLILEGIYLGGRVMGVRKEVFSSDDFQKKAQDLLEEHKKAFPNARFVLGYPDMGSGRYADKLSYADWYRFNNAQRAHHNYLESVWGVFGLLLAGGLFAPRVYASLGAIYFVSRLLYAVGYTSALGPKGREGGAILGLLSTMGMVGYSIYLGVTLVKPSLGK